MFIEFLKKNKVIIIEIFIISALVIFNSFIFTGHYRTVFVDRGRELLIPLSILNGDVLYKSVLTIYSPLSYFINALGMVILGKNISSLYVMGTLNCCIFLSVFYFLCREFFNKFFSWLLVFVVLYGCVCTDGIVNYVFGHSFGMTYGLTSYLISVFCSLKFLKNKNINFMFLSAFFAGTAVCLKADFFPILFILLLPAFWQKICIKDALKALGFLLITPVSVLCILFFQGLNFEELINALKFMSDFAKTDSMMNFYREVGALPEFTLVKIFRYIFYFFEFIISCFLIYFGLFTEKANSKIIVSLFFIISLLFLLFFAEPYYHFVFFPYILLFIFVIKFTNIIKEKELFLIILSSFGLLIRVWADLRMNFYGIYVLPWVYLTFAIIMFRFCSNLKIFSKVKVETFLILFYSIHLIYYFASDVQARDINSQPVKTDRGTIYLPQKSAEETNDLIEFIKNNTSETDKILVLPEGQMINFLCDRNSDMKLHMLDRLYYDALTPEKSLDLLKNTDYNYIVVVKGLGLENFGKPYLYEEKNPVTDFIFENYDSVKRIGSKDTYIDIKKKK